MKIILSSNLDECIRIQLAFNWNSTNYWCHNLNNEALLWRTCVQTALSLAFFKKEKSVCICGRNIVFALASFTFSASKEWVNKSWFFKVLCPYTFSFSTSLKTFAISAVVFSVITRIMHFVIMWNCFQSNHSMTILFKCNNQYFIHCSEYYDNLNEIKCSWELTSLSNWKNTKQGPDKRLDFWIHCKL